jgi:diadenosine tetraphosphate (Ap4A) HIT family hydrolase
MACELCAEPRGDVLYEDDRALVLLHDDWSVRGHAMIVARRHVENASALDEEEWLHLTRVWHRVERVLLEVTHSDRAIAVKLGIMTPHLHIHLYPVSKDATREDVFAAIDGKKREERDEGMVETLRELLTPPRD